MKTKKLLPFVKRLVYPKLLKNSEVRQRPPNERRRLVYMQDNAPSHAARQKMSYFTSIVFFRIQTKGLASVFTGFESD